MSEPKICSQCEKPATAKGLCRTHYAKSRREAKRNAPVVDTSPMRLQGEVSAERLEEFAYKANDADLEYWEGNEAASPLHVPDALKKKYPNMDWRWVSKRTLENRGAGYNGWQIFSDGQYKEGLKRGNDSFLAAMPKERAQRYRDYVSERSMERIRSVQEKAVTAQIGSTMSDEELKQMGAPDGAHHGLSIGERPRTTKQFGNRTIRGGGGTRGLTRSDLRQMAQEEINRRRANRSYSFAK